MSGLPEAAILHIDDDLVVVDKPAGVASVPERADDADCIPALLAARLGARVWSVHRIDKDTSGVLLLARNPAAHRTASLAFERREVRKTYVGLVAGVPAAPEGTIDAPLRIFGSGRTGVDPARGRPALTRWRLLRASPDGATALLELVPETGRQHQIRAHLHHVGHPLAGDPRYGGPANRALADALRLHAWRLEWAGRSWEAPLPGWA